MWETMQAKAEEKRKGYTCIVWVESPVTRDMLAQIERRSTSGQDVDEDGEACIEVSASVIFRNIMLEKYSNLMFFIEYF